MLRISDCPLSRFQNEEHYKFQTDVNGLITFFTATSLLIAAEYDAFLKPYEDEGEALNFVRKSSYSDQLHAAEMKINETLDGIEHVINSGTKHYIPAVREASYHLKTLWKTNGDIKTKSQKNKFGAILKLIADLRGYYRTDTLTVGLDGWINQLEIDYNDYTSIENNIFEEKDDKTHLRMKQVRAEIDAAYRAVTEKINALIIVNGEAPYADFVNKLNLHIDSYTNNLALRKGKGKNPTDPTAPKA